MKPFVSIITPVKDELSLVIECATSVKNLTYPKRRYEHLVVLDAKSPRKEEIREAIRVLGGSASGNAPEKDVGQGRSSLYILDGGVGSAANRNIGAAHASARAAYLAFTDADCAVDKEWLSILVERIGRKPAPAPTEDRAGQTIYHASYGCVGGINLTPASDSRLSKLFGTMESTLLGGGGSSQSAYSKEEREVPSIPNCNALYRKQLWMENKQDESLLVGQDGEFNYRLHQQGVRFLVVPAARVEHHQSATLRQHLRRLYKYGQATRRIFRKHHGILLVRWYALGPVALITGSAILSMLGWWLPIAWTALSALLGTYLAAVLLTAIICIIPRRGLIGFLSLIIFPLQHLAYGIGFLEG